jgi:hypothetical protein
MGIIFRVFTDNRTEFGGVRRERSLCVDFDFDFDFFFFLGAMCPKEQTLTTLSQNTGPVLIDLYVEYLREKGVGGQAKASED